MKFQRRGESHLRRNVHTTASVFKRTHRTDQGYLKKIITFCPSCRYGASRQRLLHCPRSLNKNRSAIAALRTEGAFCCSPLTAHRSGRAMRVPLAASTTTTGCIRHCRTGRWLSMDVSESRYAPTAREHI